MALQGRSLFTYGLEVTTLNRSIDFRAAPGGDELFATLKLGYYSLSSFLLEIKRALEAADLDHAYTVTADRTVNGGTENRITIASDGAHLDLLFSSGLRAASSAASLMGFTATDKTGATSYQSASSAGSNLLTHLPGNNWIPPNHNQKKFGNVNITASGKKEAIIYSTQKFFQAEWAWIPLASNSVADVDDWVDLLDWLTSQKPFDFTPDVSSPGTFYEATLESTAADSAGLGFSLNPAFRGALVYNTGLLKFRVKE